MLGVRLQFYPEKQYLLKNLTIDPGSKFFWKGIMKGYLDNNYIFILAVLSVYSAQEHCN
jgi:hypothetical protein